MAEWLLATVTAWGIAGWVLYFRERDYRADVLTDLVQLIHDRDIDREDLRRSLGREPVEDAISRYGAFDEE